MRSGAMLKRGTGQSPVLLLSEILQILSLSLFEKTPIFQALSEQKPQDPEPPFSNQLSLFHDSRTVVFGNTDSSMPLASWAPVGCEEAKGMRKTNPTRAL